MNGEYYVFCRRCGVKVFNTEARLNEEGWWQCRSHKEILQYAAYNKRPTATYPTPAIVRKPNTDYDFSGGADRYWDTTEETWDALDVTWDKA